MKLDAAFYQQDVLTVAPALVGMRICRRLPNGEVACLRITQTEAYRGTEDEACHAHRDRPDATGRTGRTKRTENLYRAGGFSYVYMIYGLHFLLNVVTGSEDEPQAALLRAAEAPFDGPAKLTKRLVITMSENALWLPGNDTLWIEDDGFRPALATAPRVGVDYAGKEWRDKPWRFIAKEE